MRSLFKKSPLLFGALLVAGNIYAYTKAPQAKPRNLLEALDYYGMKSQEQKQAMRFLLQAAAGEHTANSLLENDITNDHELASSILDFAKLTQEKFTIRSGAKERWEVETSAWMTQEAQHTKILDALNTLNLLEAVPPAQQNPDVICVLGASNRVMTARLKYADRLVSEQGVHPQWLVMLAGERYVTPDENGVYVDGAVDELSALARSVEKSLAQLTETDLMRAAFKSSALYTKYKDTHVLLDTPRGDLPRPTTETTVTKFCAWLKEHPEVQSVVFISNQPHVKYQYAIISHVFTKQGVNIRFEVAGDTYKQINTRNTAGNINYLVQALGSQIWATTPAVLDAIGLNLADADLQEKCKALYKSQPLIYSHFGHKFTPENKPALK